jgi:hypothetical protein
MASSFSRTGSTSNRRSANINGTRSRVSTSRASEYEEPKVQHGDLSPKDYESSLHERQSERRSNRLSRDLNTTEWRTEKKNVVTREKILKRSPVKESAGAGNRGENDRQRRLVEGPTSRRKEKESEERKETRSIPAGEC